MTTPWQDLRALDDAWTQGFHSLSARIERSDACFVAWLSENHTLLVANEPELDADDTLAQIILHEVCHHLVEGPQSWDQDDWGLNNQTEDDVAREYAALRLQAALLHTPRLRRYLQPTTDHRWFYETLADDPLRDAVHPATDDESRAAAQRGFARWKKWTHRATFQALLVESDALLSSRARAR